MQKLLILISLTISIFPALGQKLGQIKIDSLLSELPKAKEDTNKVNLLTKLARAEAVDLFQYDQTIAHCNEAIALAEKLNFKQGEATANGIIGWAYNQKKDFRNALKHYETALQIWERLGNTKREMNLCNNIGNTYQSLNKFEDALRYMLKALAIAEKSGDKSEQANDLNNIGVFHNMQGQYEESLKYLNKALKYYQELGDRFAQNHPYNNMGNSYLMLGNPKEALKYYEECYKIRIEMKDPYQLMLILNNIGLAYNNMKEYSKAQEYYEKSFKIASEVNDIEGLAMYYSNMGNIYLTKKEYSKSKTSLDKGLVYYEQLGGATGLSGTHYTIAILDSAMGNYKDAFAHYKLYNLYMDSLVNDKNNENLLQQKMQYDFEKKEATTKADQDEKDIHQRNIRNSISASLAVALIFLVVVYRQRNKISKARKRSDELLLNILPSETAEELKATGSAEAKDFDEVTVMFTDFKNFTQASEQMNAKDLVKEINYYFSEFDKIILKHNIEKIKTIGDSYMCAGGLPVANKTNAKDVVDAALEIQHFMNQLKEEREKENKHSFEIRIGIHTGPVVAGIVGIKKFAYDIWGDTVNIASRMESSGEAGKVNVSGTTYELVKEKFSCSYRGKVQAKHKGEIDMYFVEGIVSI